MAEALGVLGAIASASQLLHQAASVLRRLRKAHQSKKELVEVIDQHDCELKSIKTIIEIIEDEEALKTVAVTTEIVRLKNVEGDLVNHLRRLDPGDRGAAKQFAHELIHGSAEEKKLASIMTELCHVKSALLLRIQVASVGVIKAVGDQLVANTEVIDRVDRFLKEELNGVGLKIAQLVRGRRPSHDGTVPLTLADLKQLNDESDSEDGTLVSENGSAASSDGDAQLKTERIIIGNMTEDQALMLNSPIGKDIWKNISRLEIRDNHAKGSSTMINYPMNIDLWKDILDRRDKGMAEERKLERQNMSRQPTLF